MTEVGVIRGLDPGAIDQIVERRNMWRTQTYMNHYTVISPQKVKDLKDLCQYLQSVQDKIKLVISYNYCYIYTNDLSIADDLVLKPYVQYRSTTEAVVNRAVGTIKLCDPKWTHRTYFKDRSITDQTREQLTKYLQNRTNVRLSPGLTTWIQDTDQWRRNWLFSYYFIDHNNDGEFLLLNMAAPGLVGKTLAIVAK